MPNDFFGINLRDFVIGVQGGFSGIFLLRKSKARDIIAHGLVGGMAANYIGPWLSVKLGTPHDLTGWAIGVAGMAFLHLIIDQVESWNPTKRLKND